MIDGENHEHSAVSKINLVDLAGSERQELAKTTGDRLRVSISGDFVPLAQLNNLVLHYNCAV